MPHLRQTAMGLGLICMGAAYALTSAESDSFVLTMMAPDNFASPQGSAVYKSEITLTLVVSLLDKEPRLLPDYSFFVIQHESNRFVAVTKNRDQLAVFDDRGHVERLLGKKGLGPGEFLRISHILPEPSGSLFAYDDQLRNLTPIGSDLGLGPSIPMLYTPALILEDGRLIVAEQIRTPELIGYPIHLVNREGRVLRSFGAETPQYRSDLRQFTDRIVSPGPNGSVWAAAPGRYAFERWDPVSGIRLAKVVVHSPWFREAPTISDRRNHPSPSIESFWEKDGFIWVLLRDADTKWKPPLGSNRERPFDLEDYNRTYDWLLEVIDPESGRVVASKRFPDFLWGRSPSPFLISRRSTGGSVGFDVWKPKVKERSS
jgi:hypothetical protein